jgi:rhamnogalacturonyl hydrolase YesR
MGFGRIYKKCFLFCFAACMVSAISAANNRSADTIQQNAMRIAQTVADKLIRDTRFAFRPVPQKEDIGMQVIDFREMLKGGNETGYAFRQAVAANDTLIHFGINGAGNISIWINQEEVYHQEQGKMEMPHETAYNRFLFQHSFSGKFKKGINEMLIRYQPEKTGAVLLLRPQDANGDLNTAINFNSALPFAVWHLIGPFSGSDRTIKAEENIRTFYEQTGKKYVWEKMPQRLLPQLLIDSNITYQRDPYADWHYANGNTVWSIMNLATVTGNKNDEAFVKKYTGFIINNKSYFEKQYDSLFAFRGSFHRLFRMSMLDDAGSAVLPFIQLYLVNHDPALRPVIDTVADYIFNRQLRLNDGTFCRPEPTEFTVWADDLFMSVPFLLRMTTITGQEKYRNDAVAQMMHFRKYLLDPATGLYKHGWFSATAKQSAVYWGRANGWIAWATAELLSALPQSHPAYREVLRSLQEQIAVLAKYQDQSGMWHQVLDNSASYEETSCTAMFTMVMAKAVREGWVDQQYRFNAIKGWKAVAGKIEADGTVHGICRGTEIGYDQQFYFNRPTVDQDPRGLGAVIAAGMEISRLR